MTRRVEVRARTDEPKDKIIPVFEDGSWVRLFWDPKISGVVSYDMEERGGRVVGFTDSVTGIDYAVPPHVLERILSPFQEDLATVILGEDLSPHAQLEEFTMEDARAIVSKIINAIREEDRRVLKN